MQGAGGVLIGQRLGRRRGEGCGHVDADELDPVERGCQGRVVRVVEQPGVDVGEGLPPPLSGEGAGDGAGLLARLLRPGGDALLGAAGSWFPGRVRAGGWVGQGGVGGAGGGCCGGQLLVGGGERGGVAGPHRGEAPGQPVGDALFGLLGLGETGRFPAWV